MEAWGAGHWRPGEQDSGGGGAEEGDTVKDRAMEGTEEEEGQ